jgi:hypothetical protein
MAEDDERALLKHILVQPRLDVAGQGFHRAQHIREGIDEHLFLARDDVVVHADRGHAGQVTRGGLVRERSPVRARQRVAPPQVMGSVGPDADAATLAGAHAAGHRALNGDLHWELPLAAIDATRFIMGSGRRCTG